MSRRRLFPPVRPACRCLSWMPRLRRPHNLSGRFLLPAARRSFHHAHGRRAPPPQRGHSRSSRREHGYSRRLRQRPQRAHSHRKEAPRTAQSPTAFSFSSQLSSFILLQVTFFSCRVTARCRCAYTDGPGPGVGRFAGNRKTAGGYCPALFCGFSGGFLQEDGQRDLLCLCNRHNKGVPPCDQILAARLVALTKKAKQKACKDFLRVWFIPLSFYHKRRKKGRRLKNLYLRPCMIPFLSAGTQKAPCNDTSSLGAFCFRVHLA